MTIWKERIRLEGNIGCLYNNMPFIIFNFNVQEIMSHVWVRGEVCTGF